MIVADVFSAVLGTPKTTGMSDWITAREAAEITGYNIDYVRLLIHRGKLQYHKKDDGKWLVSKAEIINYAKKHAAEPPDGYISVAEACKLTGYSQPNVSRIVRLGLIKYVTCKGRTFVCKEDVIRYARQNRRCVSDE